MLTAGSGEGSQQYHKCGDFFSFSVRRKWTVWAYCSTARNCHVPDHCWHQQNHEHVFCNHLSWGSYTVGVLQNWKRTDIGWPVLADTAILVQQPCLSGSVVQIVLVVDINITEQIALSSWIKDKEEKIYLTNTAMQQRGGCDVVMTSKPGQSGAPVYLNLRFVLLPFC